MKKFFFGLTFFILAASSCLAKGTYQNGTLFLNNHDSINCQINVYDTDILICSSKINYIYNDKNLKINSSEVESIRLGNTVYEKFNKEVVRSVPKGSKKTHEISQQTFFAALIKDGPTKLYCHYSCPTNNLKKDSYIKSGDQLKKIDKMAFKEDCKELFQCYPDAVIKIEADEYEYSSIDKLVDFVNTEYCKK